MNARHEKRIDPLPLDQMPAADLERMQRDGLGCLYMPQPTEEEIFNVILSRVWNLFYDDFVKNGRSVVSTFFTWDGDTSTGDFKPPYDGICCDWGDHFGIGVEKVAFSYPDAEKYITFLLIHELAHVKIKGPHGDKYENCLNRLLENITANMEHTLQTIIQATSVRLRLSSIAQTHGRSPRSGLKW